MSIDATEDKLQHATLFGNPVLYTQWLIQRDTVPKDWFCYDLSGTKRKPYTPSALVDDAGELHAGSVLSPVALKRSGTRSRKVGEQFVLDGREMTLEEFCNRHNLNCPVEKLKFDVRPASPEEAGLFYTLPEEKDAELGAIGHVRIDFGHEGKEFWHTWWPRGPEELNSPEFKDELGQVVKQLRERGPLKNLSAMRSYCSRHGGEIQGGWTQSYGYVIETDHYRFCLRCVPVKGDYNGYLTAYDLRVQEMNQRAKQAEKARESFPSSWNIGDTCHVITNKAKRYTQPYTVESFDGTYFGIRGKTGMFHRVSPDRMFRSHEDAVSSLKSVQELELEREQSDSGFHIEPESPSFQM